MKKYLIGCITLFLAVFGVDRVFAGGCCYKSFSSTNGIAGKQEATIQVSFIDPTDLYVDAGKTVLRPLENEKIDIHVISPQAGQSCRVVSESTDANGAITATCFSERAGVLSIYFSAPNLDVQANQWMSAVAKQVYFDADSAVSSTPAYPSIIYPTNTPGPTREIQPTNDGEERETQQLKNQIQNLEQKVAKQQEEVHSLRVVLNKILDYFNNLFR